MHRAARLLRAGLAVEMWGWANWGRRWRVKRMAVRAEDLADVVLEAPQYRRQPKSEGQSDSFG
jgi:hypothetical protein